MTITYAVIAIVCASLYGLLMLTLFLAQRVLIYPGSIIPKDEPVLDGCERLVTLQTSTGSTVVAQYAPAIDPNRQVDTGEPESKTYPTVLYFYGNGCSVASSREVVRNLRKRGLNVIVPDYPGYGLSEGKSSEAGCRAAADAVYDYALSLGAEPPSMMVMGWSLGSGIAVDLASRRPVGGLVTLSAYTSIPEMASRRYPIVPRAVAWLLCKTRLHSEDRIASVTCPILLIHGTDDFNIPCSMSDRLARATKAPATCMPVGGVAHNNMFTLGGPEVYPAIARFAHEATGL